jgi:putative endonuclease
MKTMSKPYCVYILTNTRHTVLYIGVTNDLVRRLIEHKEGLGNGNEFTKKYNLTKLVHYEIYHDVRDAIAREKQLKGGSRKKKEELILKNNPERKDLAIELFL